MSAAGNRELIERFYAAFARRDGDAMAACYAANARFRDPVFTLDGAHVGAMWRMLCSRGVDLRVECAGVEGDDAGGAARWQAWYTFSTTGRAVHNVVHARFAIRDGRIVEHIDAFDFWRWARQALGPAGLLLGWSPVLRAKVRRQAASALARYEAGGGEPRR
jgi:ketosteroid isomerase-like protein